MLGPSLLQLGRQRLLLLAEQIHLLRLDCLDLAAAVGRRRHMGPKPNNRRRRDLLGGGLSDRRCRMGSVWPVRRRLAD